MITEKFCRAFLLKHSSPIEQILKEGRVLRPQIRPTCMWMPSYTCSAQCAKANCFLFVFPYNILGICMLKKSCLVHAQWPDSQGFARPCLGLICLGWLGMGCWPVSSQRQPTLHVSRRLGRAWSALAVLDQAVGDQAPAGARQVMLWPTFAVWESRQGLASRTPVAEPRVKCSTVPVYIYLAKFMFPKLPPYYVFCTV